MELGLVLLVGLIQTHYLGTGAGYHSGLQVHYVHKYVIWILQTQVGQFKNTVAKLGANCVDFDLDHGSQTF